MSDLDTKWVRLAQYVINMRLCEITFRYNLAHRDPLLYVCEGQNFTEGEWFDKLNNETKFSQQPMSTINKYLI